MQRTYTRPIAVEAEVLEEIEGLTRSEVINAFGEKVGNLLIGGGFSTLGSIAEAEDADILAIKGIGKGTLQAIRAEPEPEPETEAADEDEAELEKVDAPEESESETEVDAEAEESPAEEAEESEAEVEEAEVEIED